MVLTSGPLRRWPMSAMTKCAALCSDSFKLNGVNAKPNGVNAKLN